jgi:hypothetical protein
MKDKEKREKAWRIPRAISLEDKVNFENSPLRYPEPSN